VTNSDCSGATPLCQAGVCAAGAWTAQTPLGSYGSANDQFYDPIGVAISANGLELYIADNNNKRIGVWKRPDTNTAWAAQTPLGSSGTGNDQFNTPYGVAISTDGLELYVADAGNPRIAVWTRTSTTDAWTAQTPLGSYGTGNNQFSSPVGVAISTDGLTLYVSDNFNHRISVWTRTTTAGTWTAQTPLGNGPGTSDNQFSYPGGVAISTDGLGLYVADSGNNRIALWTRTTISGAWTAQTPLGNGQPTAGTASDQFNSPTFVAISPDGLALYITDTSNNRLAVWTRTTTAGTWTAQTPLGNGQGSANDQFGTPRGVAIAPDGLELYIASNYSRIAVWKYV
jgi:DNA-binding beta-propeller fold protein YncE